MDLELPFSVLSTTIGAASAELTQDAVPRAPAALQPIAHLPVGATLNGRYRVVEVLGAGSVGLVYRVIDDLHPDRDVALKTIHPAAVHPARVAMFRSEFRMMATLRHPNLVTVYDFEPVQGMGEHLFTMECVPGVGLYDATVTADWPRIVDLLVQICRVLSYVHSRQIIHFDLKPANVIVDAPGKARVLDFGIAGALGGASGRLYGTPLYMAPEIAAGETQIDHRVDLYSLGMVAYHLLCRRLPFQAATLAALLHMHRSEPVRFEPSDCARLPAWLRDVVERLCAKNPADRFPTANAVIQDINGRSGLAFELETRETRESYILSSRLHERLPDDPAGGVNVERHRVCRPACVLASAAKYRDR